MSKQNIRQTGKQNRSANKPNAGQAVQNQLSNGQTVSKPGTNLSPKPASPVSKPGLGEPAKQSQLTSRQMNRRTTREEQRREEKRRQEEERQRAARRRRVITWSSIVAAVLVVSVVAYFVITNINSSRSTTTQGTPTIPDTASQAYPVIGGVPCDTSGHDTDYHIHVHVTIYLNGKQTQIPAQVGIPDQTCLYWLHTHDTSGVIHIEAPAGHTYTLGNFFQIWGQQFSALQYPPELDQHGGAGWQVYVNGKLYNGDFHNILLTAHTLITLAYNTSGITPDTTYSWGDL